MSRIQVAEGQQEVKGMQTFFPPRLSGRKAFAVAQVPSFPKAACPPVTTGNLVSDPHEQPGPRLSVGILPAHRISPHPFGHSE